MKRFVIATHGELAKGVLDTLELIMGSQKNFEAVCAYKNGENDISSRVRELVEQKKENEDLIVITDLFGGSVNNEFMNYTDREGIYLISGVNLSLLLELVVNQEEPSEVMIRRSVELAREAITYCNRKKEIRDEEF